MLPVRRSCGAEAWTPYPVTPLDETVYKMMENRPAYEPALEMIAEEYDVDMDIDATHHGQSEIET